MNRIEREGLLERYLAGDMSAAEVEEFFIKVALDRELRGELQAHRAIDGAVRKEIAAEPGRHSAVRERVMTLLATTPAPAPTSPVDPVAGWSISWTTSLALVALVAAVLLIVLPMLNREGEPLPFGASTGILVAAIIPPAHLPTGKTSAIDLLQWKGTRRENASARQGAQTTRDALRPARRVKGRTEVAASATRNGEGMVRSERKASTTDRNDDSIPVSVRVRIGGEKR